MKKILSALCLALMASSSIVAQDAATMSSFAPRVQASYIPRGVNFALGRITSKGKNITQEGFCYSSTNPLPTINDNVTFDNTWTHNGTIYRIEGLQPTTIYYIRAYAINENGEVGYSPVQKICTLKESTATFTYDNGGSAAENERIYNATAEAIQYYHKATNFVDYDVEVAYNASVPTADCYYGGHIRVGSNPSYQATGTLLHEMNHGVGVGQHSRWMNDANLRSGTTTGNWLGTRANKVVQFFENNETAVLKGDNQHMWPYGINGASEDNHTELLYTANVMITQALAEDGLPPTYTMANGAPSMVFDAQQGVKYYIKSECKGLGFEHGFLADEAGKIVWREKTADEVMSDDSFAWNITFDPVSSRYMFQNVASGNYITKQYVINEDYPYGTDILALAQCEAGSEIALMQLLGSRKDVIVNGSHGKFTKQGYWLFYPRPGYWGNDPTLQAEEGGATQSTIYFAFGNKNTNQRWLFLTADEVRKFESATGNGAVSDVAEVVAYCKDMLAVPHTELNEGADAAFTAVIEAAEQYIAQGGNVQGEGGETVTPDDMVQQLHSAVDAFLHDAEPQDAAKPFDLTFLIMNSDLTDGTEGWDESPEYAAGVCEYVNEKIAFTQKVMHGLPVGKYALHVQGFQRPGDLESFASAQTNASLTLGTKTSKIANIISEAQDVPLHETDIKVGDKYIPNTMAGAAEYFKAGLYNNVFYVSQDRASSSMTIGVKASTARADYWTCFKGFKLFYYGSLDPTGIEAVTEVGDEQQPVPTRQGIYSLCGTLISRDINSLEALPSGVYIVNGKKIMK